MFTEVLSLSLIWGCFGSLLAFAFGLPFYCTFPIGIGLLIIYDFLVHRTENQ